MITILNVRKLINVCALISSAQDTDVHTKVISRKQVHIMINDYVYVRNYIDSSGFGNERWLSYVFVIISIFKRFGRYAYVKGLL